jgi:hypothetical protein
MTKVEAHYEFTATLDDQGLAAIDRSHSVYGLHSVRLSPQLDRLTVLYDASRLQPLDVDEALLGLGLPVRRV